MQAPPPSATQQDVLTLLRGRVPEQDHPASAIEPCLKRYECGGYLWVLWSGEGRAALLPPGWRAALEAAHRSLAIDNLAALSAFRAVGRLLHEEGVPFALLKGAAYLVDLYPDPAARMLTDIDLLLGRADAGRIARRLRREGYQGEIGPDYPEYRRFEMWRPGAGHCRIEFHWRLGLPGRLRADQEGLWARSRPATLEGIGCLRLEPVDAVLYHTAHLADHYFGPSLKWVIDLREMFRRWRPDLDLLLRRASAWRVRVALHYALRHLEAIYPGEAPPGLADRLLPAGPRRRLIDRRLAAGPLELIAVGEDHRSRYPLRLLLFDRPQDALRITAQVLLRPLTRPLVRAFGGAVPPWDWPG
jgi:Uncharacterised nucleotidyltransferase